MRAKKVVPGGLLGAALVLIPMGSTLAEEGLRASLTVGEKLRYVDEQGLTKPQNEGTSAVTTLGFNLTSETSNQRFSLDLGTDIPIYADDNDNVNSNFALEDPFASLNYTIDNRSSLLSFATSFRRSNVGESNFFDETINTNVVTGGGKRDLTSASLDMTLGRDGPVTTQLGYTYLRSAYDQADPTLSDSTTNSIDGKVTVQINPVASVFAFVDWRKEDRDLATQSDTTTSSLGFGATYAVSPVTSATTQLSFDRNKNNTRSTNGLGFQFGLDRDVSNGSVDFDISGTETINGFRQQVSVGRSYDLQRGTFSFSLGAVKDEGTSIEPLANLQLALDLSKSSRVNVALSQSPSFNDNDVSVIRTRLNINYDLNINSVSDLSAGLQLADDNQFGSNTGDSVSALASLTYNRELTSDWDLMGGISYKTDRRSSSPDANTTTIFVGIERTFDFRP